MKKSVKRNARKGIREKKAKNKSRKKVSIKQKGGMSLLFFICVCILVQELSKSVKRIVNPVDFKEFFKDKEVTKVQKCLVDNNDKPDPFTGCYDEIPKTIYDTDVNRGFSGCILQTLAVMDPVDTKGMDQVDIAARSCYVDGVERVEALKKKEKFEKCTAKLLTETNVGKDCSKRVIRFTYEEKVLSVKNTDEMQISTITVQGIQKPITTLAIGNGFGYFTTRDLGEVNMDRATVQEHFHTIMNAVKENLPKYRENLVFIDYDEYGDDDYILIRYFDRNNPNDVVIELLIPKNMIKVL